jgi:hypothetical protein
MSAIPVQWPAAFLRVAVDGWENICGWWDRFSCGKKGKLAPGVMKKMATKNWMKIELNWKLKQFNVKPRGSNLPMFQKQALK